MKFQFDLPCLVGRNRTELQKLVHDVVRLGLCHFRALQMQRAERAAGMPAVIKMLDFEIN